MTLNISPWKNFKEDGSDAVPAAGWVDAVKLAANTAQSYTIPALVKHIRVLNTGNIDVWMDPNKTAVIPAATITDGTAPILNEQMIYIKDQTTLSFISASDTILSIRCFIG